MTNSQQQQVQVIFTVNSTTVEVFLNRSFYETLLNQAEQVKQDFLNYTDEDDVENTFVDSYVNKSLIELYIKFEFNACSDKELWEASYTDVEVDFVENYIQTEFNRLF